jgi:hypothetical protein
VIRELLGARKRSPTSKRGWVLGFGALATAFGAWALSRPGFARPAPPRTSPPLTDRGIAPSGAVRSAALNGVLICVSVKVSKTDLDNLNARDTETGATTPAERLKELADPNANVDLTNPVKVAGSTSERAGAEGTR